MSSDMIGRKFVLWRTEYSPRAYLDQFGYPHDGYIVKEQIPVTVVETRKVKGMWGKDSWYDGWKAVSKDGEEFTCNWNSFPDDSMTPTYYWDWRSDSRGDWQPQDAIQTFGMGLRPNVDEAGNQVIPAGAVFCKTHKQVWLEGDPDIVQCYKCYIENHKKERNG